MCCFENKVFFPLWLAVAMQFSPAVPGVSAFVNSAPEESSLKNFNVLYVKFDT
jgi:hypothetical protein